MVKYYYLLSEILLIDEDVLEDVSHKLFRSLSELCHCIDIIG
jgi:hypothetical protein